MQITQSYHWFHERINSHCFITKKNIFPISILEEKKSELIGQDSSVIPYVMYNDPFVFLSSNELLVGCNLKCGLAKIDATNNRV